MKRQIIAVLVPSLLVISTNARAQTPPSDPLAPPHGPVAADAQPTESAPAAAVEAKEKKFDRSGFYMTLGALNLVQMLPRGPVFGGATDIGISIYPNRYAGVTLDLDVAM